MKKENTWNSHMSIDSFFEKLERNTYTQNFLEITLHWDENCIFFKKKSNNAFYLSYHKTYLQNSFAQRLKGKVYATSDGIRIKAKCKMNVFAKVFLTFWYTIISFVFLMVRFTNPFASLVILMLLVFPFITLSIGKDEASIMFKFMDEILMQNSNPEIK